MWVLQEMRMAEAAPSPCKAGCSQGQPLYRCIEDAFDLWKCQAAFKMNSFVRACAVAINTSMLYITAHVTNSGRLGCTYIQLNEIIKMYYVMSLRPPDSYFSDLGEERAFTESKCLDTSTLVSFLFLWCLMTFRLGDSHFSGHPPAWASTTLDISREWGQINATGIGTSAGG